MNIFPEAYIFHSTIEKKTWLHSLLEHIKPFEPKHKSLHQIYKAQISASNIEGDICGVAAESKKLKFSGEAIFNLKGILYLDT